MSHEQYDLGDLDNFVFVSNATVHCRLTNAACARATNRDTLLHVIVCRHRERSLRAWREAHPQEHGTPCSARTSLNVNTIS
jgi:hypothetical protein